MLLLIPSTKETRANIFTGSARARLTCGMATLRTPPSHSGAATPDLSPLKVKSRRGRCGRFFRRMPCSALPVRVAGWVQEWKARGISMVARFISLPGKSCMILPNVATGMSPLLPHPLHPRNPRLKMKNFLPPRVWRQKPCPGPKIVCRPAKEPITENLTIAGVVCYPVPEHRAGPSDEESLPQRRKGRQGTRRRVFRQNHEQQNHFLGCHNRSTTAPLSF